MNKIDLIELMLHGMSVDSLSNKEYKIVLKYITKVESTDTELDCAFLYDLILARIDGVLNKSSFIATIKSLIKTVNIELGCDRGLKWDDVFEDEFDEDEDAYDWDTVAADDAFNDELDELFGAGEEIENIGEEDTEGEEEEIDELLKAVEEDNKEE